MGDRILSNAQFQRLRSLELRSQDAEKERRGLAERIGKIEMQLHSDVLRSMNEQLAQKQSVERLMDDLKRIAPTAQNVRLAPYEPPTNMSGKSLFLSLVIFMTGAIVGAALELAGGIK